MTSHVSNQNPIASYTITTEPLPEGLINTWEETSNTTQKSEKHLQSITTRHELNNTFNWSSYKQKELAAREERIIKSIWADKKAWNADTYTSIQGLAKAIQPQLESRGVHWTIGHIRTWLQNHPSIEVSLRDSLAATYENIETAGIDLKEDNAGEEPKQMLLRDKLARSRDDTYSLEERFAAILNKETPLLYEERVQNDRKIWEDRSIAGQEALAQRQHNLVQSQKSMKELLIDDYYDLAELISENASKLKWVLTAAIEYVDDKVVEPVHAVTQKGFNATTHFTNEHVLTPTISKVKSFNRAAAITLFCVLQLAASKAADKKNIKLPHPVESLEKVLLYNPEIQMGVMAAHETTKQARRLAALVYAYVKYQTTK